MNAADNDAHVQIIASNELLARLRDLGMTDEDKEKLFAMKYYISKSSQLRMRYLLPFARGPTR